MLNAFRRMESEMSAFNAQVSNLVSLSEESRGANGVRYFVDGNSGADNGDGASWDAPFKSLAYALAISHANIGLRSSTWAKRNTIYVVGDALAEDLVKLAQKTDVVGMGSYDHHPKAGITGTHVIDSVASYMGCRLFNLYLRKKAGGAAAILTIPTAQSGIGILGCEVDGSDATVSTIGISATGVERLSIIGNDFIGAFSSEAIYIGTGESNGLRIEGNTILGAVKGIVTHSGLTTSVRKGLVKGNTIYTSGVTIDDEASVLICIDNKCVSDAATGDTAIKINQRLASGNTITDATKSGPWPRLDDT